MPKRDVSPVSGWLDIPLYLLNERRYAVASALGKAEGRGHRERENAVGVMARRCGAITPTE